VGGRRRAILAWAVAAAAAGAGAFTLGALGVFVPPPRVDAAISIVGSVASGPAAYDCPGGEPVARFSPGSQLYLTGRNADATWLLTRSPASGYETVWVPADSVSVDEFPVPVEQLDVVTCDAVVVVHPDESNLG
jgi:hypothetical protein